MPSQTAVFTRLVREHMRAAPPVVPAGTPCAEALARLAAADASALVVTDAEGRIAGIVTEQDVARRIAFRLDRRAPIERAMTAPVATIAADDYLYHAIAAMRRRGLRHMPVVDAADQPTGMIELHTALGLAAPQMVDQIDRLTHDQTVEGLAAVKGEQVAVAEQLFADHVPAPDILSLISQVNCDLYRRVIEMSLRAMDESGAGPPPLAFALLVMGSGGRGESVVGADQDNGFVLADYDDSEHDRIDRYFAELAERMTGTLDRVGLPLCRGGVMATSPLWRKSLSQWRAQIDFWVRRRSRAIVRLADIFFDFRPVWGELALGRALRAYLTERMPGAFPFLQVMHAEQLEHATALGWFGRLRTHGEKGHGHALNLKYDAGLPLVETIRLLSLAEGVAETGTPARIHALGAKGVLDADERDYLGAAFDLVTSLTLRQQIADFRAGRELGYWLDPATLSARERELLIDGLRAIEALRDRVKSDFTGSIF
jgi:signal-transduction protein with cAMP-binding, CBS, and nucleotidyltransferase domain